MGSPAGKGGSVLDGLPVVFHYFQAKGNQEAKTAGFVQC